MTDVLLAFATRAGTTQSIAERLGARLAAAGHRATVAPVQDDPDPAAYEALVIGAGVLGGSVYPAAAEWLSAHRAGLATRPVAVFVTCLNVVADDAGRLAQAVAYPDQLAAVLPAPALDSRVFAGAYDPGRRPRWERVAALVSRRPRGDFRDWAAVDAWAEELSGRL